MGHPAQHVGRPGPGGIDQQPGPVLGLGAGCIAAGHPPVIGLAHGRHDFGAGHDPGAAGLGIAGVQHDKPGVLDPAIGIFKGRGKAVLQRLAGRIAGQVQPFGARQDLAPAQGIIKHQPGADHPGRPLALHPGHERVQQPGRRGFGVEAHVGRQGQDKAHRPRDMRHGPQQGFPFLQGLAHQADLEIFEITQTTVEQLGRGRGRGLGQIALFGQGDRQAAPGGVAGNAATVDPASDDKDVLHARPTPLVLRSPALCKALTARASRTQMAGIRGFSPMPGRAQ